MTIALGGGATVALAILLLGITALGGGEEAVYTAELREGTSDRTTEEAQAGTARFTRHEHQATYRIDALRASDIEAVHIHAGSGVRDGPVRVYLFHSVPPVRRLYGPLEGRFGAGEVYGTSFDALMEDLALGRAYVDVHVRDVPGGIRGQVSRRRR